eukprot:38231-Chlamydomonas_euryale.AAC.5
MCKKVSSWEEPSFAALEEVWEPSKDVADRLPDAATSTDPATTFVATAAGLGAARMQGVLCILGRAQPGRAGQARPGSGAKSRKAARGFSVYLCPGGWGVQSATKARSPEISQTSNPLQASALAWRILPGQVRKSMEMPSRSGRHKMEAMLEAQQENILAECQGCNPFTLPTPDRVPQPPPSQ